MNTAKVRARTASGRVTQSYRLYKLFSKKNRSATREQIANALKLKPNYVGSYLAEFKRVYGAKVEYDSNKERYVLKNKPFVPPDGLAGRKPLPSPKSRGRAARVRRERTSQESPAQTTQ